MAISTALAVYFIIWWVVLFAVLPWGIRSQAESGEVVPGSDPGAPARPHLLAKLVSTTVVAGLVFAALAVVYAYDLIPLERLTTWFGILN
jgi:predicted secreted protein